MFYRKADSSHVCVLCVSVCKCVCRTAGPTFDRCDDGSSCAEDIHRVQALVFADNGLQDSQQLTQSLMDRVMKAVLVL